MQATVPFLTIIEKPAIFEAGKVLLKKEEQVHGSMVQKEGEFVPELVIDDHWVVGQATLVAQLYGRYFDGEENANWSLSKLREDETLQKRIGTVLVRKGFREADAPLPSFQGNLGHHLRLPHRVQAGPARINRNYNPGEEADALELTRGCAYIASPGNCPFFLATNGARVFAAHAPQWGLLPGKIFGVKGAESRLYSSVVHMIVEQLFARQGKKATRVKVYGGVRGHELRRPFDGPHGKCNKEVYKYIRQRHGYDAIRVGHFGFNLDLPLFIQQQFVRFGVPEENVSLEHAYLPDRAHKTGGVGLPRNLLLFGWSA